MKYGIGAKYCMKTLHRENLLHKKAMVVKVKERCTGGLSTSARDSAHGVCARRFTLEGPTNLLNVIRSI